MAVRLLHDTHSLIWAIVAPKRLPEALQEIVSDIRSAVFVSPVTAWEIAINAGARKVHFPNDRLQELSRQTSLWSCPSPSRMASRCATYP